MHRWFAYSRGRVSILVFAALTISASVLYATADDTATSNSAGSSERSNTAPIPTGAALTPDEGNSSLYPSSITIPSGLGTITKVVVVLRTFSHTFPQDVDVLLVGPAGQTVMLMSDAGGGTPVSGLTLTFDDSGSALGSGMLTSGTFRPSNIADGEGDDTFTSPAPAAPYGSTLAVFNGTNSAGDWSLFVRDDTAGDSGSIAGGWSLQVQTTIAEDSFTDHPLTPGTFVKRIHIIELRDAINAARAAKSLAAFSFTDPTVTAGSTPIKAAHITELRTALAQAYSAASQTPPPYTDPTIFPGTTVVKAVHISQLRAAVANLP